MGPSLALLDPHGPPTQRKVDLGVLDWRDYRALNWPEIVANETGSRAKQLVFPHVVYEARPQWIEGKHRG